MLTEQKSKTAKIPHHVAIIMDGNGRWAEKRGLPRKKGHEQGAKAAEDIIRHSNELGIKYITLFAFSSENWTRPKDEIDAVMKILERYVRNEIDELIKNNIRVNAIGDLERLPPHLRKAVADAVKKTAHCQKIVITLALSYGAWEEMIAAIKNIVYNAKKNGFDEDEINEGLCRKYLYTKDMPDPDLFIRTGGEIRLSNFLLMQISYSELYFSKTLWPDFQRADFDRAIKSYQARKRRFGSVVSSSL